MSCSFNICSRKLHLGICRLLRWKSIELIFNICEKEYQGGSGAGCSAVVFNSYLYKKLLNDEFNKIIFMATGALLSSVSSQQGESIPGIAHAVVVESK